MKFGSNFRDALQKSLDDDLFLLYNEEFELGTATPESVKQFLDIQNTRSIREISEYLFYANQQ